MNESQELMEIVRYHRRKSVLKNISANFQIVHESAMEDAIDESTSKFRNNIDQYSTTVCEHQFFLPIDPLLQLAARGGVNLEDRENSRDGRIHSRIRQCAYVLNRFVLRFFRQNLVVIDSSN